MTTHEITSLKHGSHRSPEAGMCLLEACAYVAGEPFSDHPQCVSPVLGAFGRRINDCMPDDATRALLIPLVPRMLNTAGDGKDQRRAFMCADWAVRVAASRALDAAGLTDEAAKLRTLAPIVDRETALAGRAAAAAAYAYAAAADAAYAAAAYAAYAADDAAYAAYAAYAADDAADAAYAADDAADAAYAADDAADAAVAYAAETWSEVVEFFGKLIDAE